MGTRTPKLRTMRRGGTCFPDSFRLLERLHFEGVKEARLVHGQVTGVLPPYPRYVHAWVELRGFVLDNKLNRLVSRDRYYKVGKVSAGEIAQFDYDSAVRAMARNMHYGPWEEVDGQVPN